MKEELKEVEEATLDGHLAPIAKELADLLYVVYGTAIAYGIDLEPVFREVHRSNMSKVGGYTRDDGKWVKPDTYSRAAIEPLLQAQAHSHPRPDGLPSHSAYQAERNALLQDFSTPSWLQQLIPILEDKDPVDVLGALDVLHDLMQRRLDLLSLDPLAPSQYP